jgi:ATP:ADP antiporter, AAA family
MDNQVGTSLQGDSKKILIACVTAAFSAAFLMVGYEFARSSAASIFMSDYGAGAFPYAMTAIPVLMFVFVYLYGRLLSAVGAMKSFVLSNLVCGAVYVGSYVGIKSDVKIFSALIYVFTEVYIVVLVEQYWSFINSILKSPQAKKINGLVLGISSIGSMLGGILLSRFAKTFGTEQFLLFNALTLIPCVYLMYRAYKMGGEPKPSQSEKGGRLGHLHLSEFFGSKVLLSIAGVVFLSQVLATVLNLKFYAILEVANPVKDARTAYLGGFWSIANGAALVMNFLIVPLVMHKFKLRSVHVFIPIIHIIGCAFLLFYSSLPVAAGIFMFSKVMSYSLFRAAREPLYIPLSFDARYRAKQIADSFTYRFSKGFSAGSISLAKNIFATFSTLVYPIIAVVASVFWFVLAFPLTSKDDVKNA